MACELVACAALVLLGSFVVLIAIISPLSPSSTFYVVVPRVSVSADLPINAATPSRLVCTVQAHAMVLTRSQHALNYTHRLVSIT